jgi:hypothetical protein
LARTQRSDAASDEVDGGEYITVAPRRIAAPVPFEFARVSLPTRERPAEFLVFAPQHTYRAGARRSRRSSENAAATVRSPGRLDSKREALVAIALRYGLVRDEHRRLLPRRGA